MLKTILIAAALVASTAAFGKDLTLPLGRIITLHNAIMALDNGQERTIKDGASEKVIRESYKFDVGLRLVMSRNLSAIKPFIDGYEKERNAVYMEIGGGAQIKNETPEALRLQLAERKLQDIPQKIALMTIPEAALKLDVNAIPVSVISGLEPIIEFAQ